MTSLSSLLSAELQLYVVHHVVHHVVMSYIIAAAEVFSRIVRDNEVFYFLESSFFFALPFFLFVPNLDANHPLSLTLLHYPLTVLTPNSFQSSFNLVPHLLFPSSTSRTILFHVRSSSPQ